MLFLARVNVHIGIASVFTDHLTFVYGFVRSEEERAAFLDIAQTVRGGFPRFDGDQRAARPHRNLPFERSVPVENVVHDAVAFRAGQKFVAETDQTARRNDKFHAQVTRQLIHADEFRFARSETFHDGARRIISIKIDKCNSPRPDTLNASAESVSSTFIATFVCTSFIRRARK